MGKNHLLLSNMTRNSFLLVIGLLILAGCKTVDNVRPDEAYLAQQEKLAKERAAISKREDKLTAREAAVSIREADLITLFAEVVKQKNILENQQAQQSIDKAAASEALANARNHKKTTVKSVQPSNNNNASPKNSRTILGELEHVYLEPPGTNFSARVDTGAQTSSLNALDMVEFERDGQPYIRFNILDPITGEKIELTRRIRGYVRIKEVNNRKSQRRPIVRMRVVLGNIDERVNFTLVDRTKFKQQVLIGRNFLRDLAVVDVSKAYTIPKFNPDSE